MKCPLRTVLDINDFTRCISCPIDKPRYDREKK